MSTSEITSKVRELKELKAMLEEIEAEIATIEDEIKAEMTARNTEEMSVDVYKVRWTKVTSSRFDTSAFKKPMPSCIVNTRSRRKHAVSRLHEKSSV